MVVRPEISVSLNKASETYHPGEEVSGMVHVFCQEDNYHISQLTVSLRGYAKLVTYERRERIVRRGRHRHIEYYYITNNEDAPYFNINTDLVSAPVTALNTSNWSIRLSRGRTEYRFRFTLPTEIPSSYENEGGSVIYEITVTLTDNYFYWISNANVIQRKKIWVIASYNLANEPMANEEIERFKETMVCCLCCKTGPISMSVHLGHMGYLPGEHVQFSAEIINNSSCFVSSTVTLQEIATFRRHSVQGDKTTTKRIASAIGPNVLEGSTQLWERRSLQVPLSTVPTNLGGHSAFIDVRYQLVVSLTMGGRGIFSSLQIAVPIIVGTERTLSEP